MPVGRSLQLHYDLAPIGRTVSNYKGTPPRPFLWLGWQLMLPPLRLNFCLLENRCEAGGRERPDFSRGWWKVGVDPIIVQNGDSDHVKPGERTLKDIRQWS